MKFLHALTHRVHWFPVVRILTVLDLVELVAGFAPGCQREGTKIIQGTASELDGF